MANALLQSIRTAAQVCLDNAQIVRELQATADLWPAGTVAHARQCGMKTEQMFGALVRMYLRSLSERTPAHGGGSGG